MNNYSNNIIDGFNGTSPDNRLAPYSPTHATAQSRALDLLRLTPRDVFFDLGCGDGRMIIAALERCYNDDDDGIGGGGDQNDRDVDNDDGEDDNICRQFVDRPNLMSRRSSSRSSDKTTIRNNLIVQSATTTSVMTTTIPADIALGRKAVLHNNLTTKVSNTTSGSGSTRPPLSTSFFVHAAHGGVDGGNGKNSSNDNVNNYRIGASSHSNCSVNHLSSFDDSEYSVPHLMRTPSQDDDDDVSGSFFDNRSDNTTLLSMSPNRIPHHHHHCLRSPSPPPSPPDEVGEEEQHHHQLQQHRDHGDGGMRRSRVQMQAVVIGSRESIPVLSPPVQQRRVLTPNTPVTPVVDNRRLTTNQRQINCVGCIDINDGRECPALPLNDDDDDDNDDGDDDDDGDRGIPKTIQTPSADAEDDERQKRHHHRNYFISSLTVFPDQQLLFAEEEGGSDDNRQRTALAQTTALEAIPSGDELFPSEEPPGSDGSETENVGHEADAASVAVAKTPGVLDVPGGRGDGLRCVGIEYNQALAESAQDNVQRILACMPSSSRPRHVMGNLLEEKNPGRRRCSGEDEGACRCDDDDIDGGGLGDVHRVSWRNRFSGDGGNQVCIRWGNVLEEWNRSRCRGSGKNGDDDVGGMGNVHRVSWHDGGMQGEGGSEEEVDAGNGGHDVCELTLLDDATAVFVYLLPKGLEKIKPILYEAAVIRHRQRERQKSMQDQPQWQLQLRQQQNPLYPLQESQLVGVTEEEDTSALLTNASEDDQDGLEFSPLPPRYLRKRGGSHVSDITDDSFYNTRTSLEGIGLGMEVLRILHEEERYRLTVPKLVSSTHQPQSSTKKKNSLVPCFRVVSYMFSIPGWTPMVVDRSSKGQCPLFLYENIHEETSTL